MEKKKEDAEVVNLKLFTGGKTPEHRWMDGLNPGAMIIIRAKKFPPDVFNTWSDVECHLEDKYGDNVAHLALITYEGTVAKAQRDWVDIDEFCKKWDLKFVIDEGVASAGRMECDEATDGSQRDSGVDQETG